MVARTPERVARQPDAPVEPGAAAIAHREAVDVLGIRAGRVLAERVGSVQVPEAGLARRRHVVGVEITLRPAQVVADAAQAAGQRLARQPQLVGDAGALGLDVAGAFLVPARVRVGMGMEFERAGGAHGLDLAPAQHDLVGAAGGDQLLAGVVVRRGGQRAALPRMRPDGAVADPAGDDEQDGAHAVARQHRMRVDPVVQVAVVEGDQHRTLGHGRAGQAGGELIGRQRLVAGARQARDLVLEHVRRGGDHAAGRRHVVVHQHRHVGRAARAHLPRSASHLP